MSPYRVFLAMPSAPRVVARRLWSRPAAMLLLHLAVAHSGRCSAFVGTVRATSLWLQIR